jgi:hypothetical protein
MENIRREQIKMKNTKEQKKYLKTHAAITRYFDTNGDRIEAEKQAKTLERYATIADYFDNNKHRIEENKHPYGVLLYHTLLDNPKNSQDAVKIRDKIYKIFFEKHAKKTNLIENLDGKESLMEEYAMILDYFNKNPEKVSETRAHLNDTYNSIKELKKYLPKNDADYSRLQGFEKGLKSLLMKDLTNKLKDGTGTGTGVFI